MKISLKIAALAALLGALTAAPAQADLIAFYPFSTNAALDVSGNNRHGTLSANAPVFTGSGFQGGAFEFDGVNEKTITLPIDMSPSVLPVITFGCWANVSSASLVIRGLISHDNGGFDRTINVDTRVNNELRWFAFSSTANGGANVGPAVNQNQWVFLAVRHDQNTGQMDFDVDGQKFSLSGVQYDAGGETVATVGRNPNFDAPFAGRVDNVFFYDEYLSDARVAEIRAGGERAILTNASAPEPGTFALAGVVALGAVAFRRARRG